LSGLQTSTDLWLVPVDGETKPSAWLETRANENFPSFSPDGRWIAYVSDESGRQELYVTSFPDARGKWQVSTAGAEIGSFSGDGRSIRYIDPENRMLSVPISEVGAALEIGPPEPLFGGEPMLVDVGVFTPDGKRFLGAARLAGDAGPALTLVTNWAEELN